MTEQTPAEPTPEAPAATESESSEDDDDESFLDSLIESVTEIPHWLFRPIFGGKGK